MIDVLGSPVKAPPLIEGRDKARLSGLLDQLNAEHCFTAIGTKEPQQETVNCGGIDFPRCFDQGLLVAPFDLRLPHSNPLLDGEGPLYQMRDDVVRLIDKETCISFPSLIGSSGVGKTTAAFLVAQQRWSIYIEATSSHVLVGEGYKMRAPSLRGLQADFEDISCRCRREVLARALILAELKRRFPALTPYEALLFQLSAPMLDCYEQVIQAL